MKTRSALATAVLTCVLAVAFCLIQWNAARNNGGRVETDELSRSRQLKARREQASRPQVQWRFKVKGGAFDAAPFTDSSRTYIGDFDGNIYAIANDTGKLVWKYPASGSFVARAAAEGQRLYVVDFDGTVYCLDKQTGQEIWTFQTEGTISAEVTFYRNKVLVASQDASLYCLHSGTGNLVWQFKAADGLYGPATVVDNYAIVVASCSSTLQVVDLRTGSHVKDLPLPAETVGQLATRGNLAFAVTMAGSAVCLDWRNDKQIWKTDLDPDYPPQTRGGVVLAKDRLIIGSDDRHVRAVDADSGRVVWDFPTKGPIESMLRVDGQRGFVTTMRGELYALNLIDGEPLWQLELGGDIRGTPSLLNNRLIVANGNGAVYCIGPIR